MFTHVDTLCYTKVSKLVISKKGEAMIVQGFRQYLKDLEEVQNTTIDKLNGAYSTNQIDDDTYVQLMRGVNGQKLMLDNISREYERTHKIWE